MDDNDRVARQRTHLRDVARSRRGCVVVVVAVASSSSRSDERANRKHLSRDVHSPRGACVCCRVSQKTANGAWKTTTTRCVREARASEPTTRRRVGSPPRTRPRAHRPLLRNPPAIYRARISRGDRSASSHLIRNERCRAVYLENRAKKRLISTGIAETARIARDHVRATCVT